MEKKLVEKILGINILDHISNGIFIIDSSRRIIFWNNVMQNWIGYKKKDVFNKSLTELFPTFKKFIYDYQINSVLRDGTTAIFSSELHRDLYHDKSGNIIDKHLHTTVSILPFNDNKPLAIFTIEDQSQLTALIIRSNKLLEQVHKKEEQLVKINQNLENLVARRTNDLQIINNELKKEIEERIKNAEHLKENRKKLQKQNLDYISLNNRLTETNQKLYEINSELEKARDKAQESDRLKTAFLANMSHEIRTPMNSIIGFSDLIQDDDISTEIRKKYLKQIQQSGIHLLALVNDIVDISKIEAQQLNIFYNRINMTTIAEEVRHNYEHVVREKGLLFEIVNKLPENFILLSDYVRIKQILCNLIDNAIKFTDEGFIELLFKKTKKILYIHVKDTGAGIKKEHHKLIFDRFYQEKFNPDKIYGGTGLGLAITKNLVKLMNGKIELKSEQGKGSTFIIKLPIRPDEETK